MKTTIDLPDDILHRAKIVAVQRKTTLKELVIQGLEHATRHSAEDAEKVRKERVAGLIAALQASNTEPMKPLSRSEIYDRHAGRWSA